MTLSMPQTRKVIRKQEAVEAELRHGLSARGIAIKRKRSKRDGFIEAAKSGRDPDLRQKAVEAVRDRRVQRDLDIIAGRA